MHALAAVSHSLGPASGNPIGISSATTEGSGACWRTASIVAVRSKRSSPERGSRLTRNHPALHPSTPASHDISPLLLNLELVQKIRLGINLGTPVPEPGFIAPLLVGLVRLLTTDQRGRSRGIPRSRLREPDLHDGACSRVGRRAQAPPESARFSSKRSHVLDSGSSRLRVGRPNRFFRRYVTRINLPGSAPVGLSFSCVTMPDTTVAR